MARSERGKPLLQVRLFGGPLLFRDGDAVPLSAYQSALLSAVFGAGGRGMTRLELIRLLWSEGDERTRRRRLSQLLYSVAGKAPPGPIAAEREQIRPDLETTASDLDEYERALAEGDLTRAMSLAERPFLGGLDEEVTDAFGDWARAKHLGLRRELRARASALWSEAHREARWSQALAAAEALLRLDPLDEEALRRVITGRAMLGKLAEAGAVRQAFEEQHRLEIGEWVPEEETRELLDRIEKIALEEGDASDEAGVPPEPPLCGREKELAVLTRQVLIEEGDGLRLVTVRGEGGMGKTRLVEEALKATRLRGIRVLTAGSSEFERDIPLNPILEALSRPDVGEVIRSLEDPWRQVLLSLMPELHEGPGPLPEIPQIQPGSLPRRLFEAIRQVFLAVAAQGPLVLFLDDFHWADDTSIAALEYLRRRWEGGGLCIVLAIRPEDLVRQGSAARFVQALEPLEEAVEIEVEDLSEEEVASLVSRLAKGSLAPEQTDRIVGLSGCNPFFVIELTLEALEGREVPGGRLHDAAPVPVSIRQVLAHRLSALSAQAERLLELVVVFERALQDSELRRASGLSNQDFVFALEELQGLRLVSQAGEKSTGVRHELIRQTVYGRLSETRRAFVHEEVALFLLGTRQSPPVDELALHFDRAGVRDQAFQFATQAANAAETSGAVPEALRFLSVARRNTDDLAESADILWRLAHLHYQHRNLSEAAPLLELAAGRLRTQGRSAEALQAEAEKLDAIASLGSVPERDLLAEINRLKSIAIGDGEWEVVATLMNTSIHIHHRSNDFAAAGDCLDELESYVGHGSEEAECLMLSSLAAHVFYGNPEKGVKFTKKGLEIAEGLGRRDLWLTAANRYLFAILNHGTFRKENGHQLSQRAQEEARRSGDLMTRYRLHANLGVWHLDVGAYDSALVEFFKAKETLQSTEATHARLNINYNIGETYYFLANIKAAEEHFHEAAGFLTPGTPDFYRDLLNAGLGLCALYKGNLADANSKERNLHLRETEWNFNPALLILFKEKMLMRRGRWLEAVALLQNQASVLGNRFPVISLQLKIRLTMLLERLDKEAGLKAELEEEILQDTQEREIPSLVRSIRAHNF